MSCLIGYTVLDRAFRKISASSFKIIKRYFNDDCNFVMKLRKSNQKDKELDDEIVALIRSSDNNVNVTDALLHRLETQIQVCDEFWKNVRNESNKDVKKFFSQLKNEIVCVY